MRGARETTSPPRTASSSVRDVRFPYRCPRVLRKGLQACNSPRSAYLLYSIGLARLHFVSVTFITCAALGMTHLFACVDESERSRSAGCEGVVASENASSTAWRRGFRESNRA